jgi:four helix bundle protein
MFDFSKLDVYKKAKSFCIIMHRLISSRNFGRTTNDQLRRASFSIMLNIEERTSRFSNKPVTLTNLCRSLLITSDDCKYLSFCGL